MSALIKAFERSVHGLHTFSHYLQHHPRRSPTELTKFTRTAHTTLIRITQSLQLHSSAARNTERDKQDGTTSCQVCSCAHAHFFESFTYRHNEPLTIFSCRLFNDPKLSDVKIKQIYNGQTREYYAHKAVFCISDVVVGKGMHVVLEHVDDVGL